MIDRCRPACRPVAHAWFADFAQLSLTSRCAVLVIRWRLCSGVEGREGRGGGEVFPGGSGGSVDWAQLAACATWLC